MQINPVFRKELKLTMRSSRLPMILLIYNSVLAFITLLVFYTIIENARWTQVMDYTSVFLLYMITFIVEGLLLAFIIPALTANAISGERERQTLDILLTTPMTPFGIILGKLMSSIGIILLLVISSIPVLAIVFAFGGVSLADVVKIVCYLVFAAVFSGAMSIACSARIKKTTTSTVVAYAGMLGLIGGTVLIVALGALVTTVSPVDTPSVVLGMISMILLINPGVTVFALLSGQFSYRDSLTVILYETFDVPKVVSDHWILLSIVVQCVFLVLMIWSASAALRPKRR